MLSYVTRRLAIAPISLLLVSLAVFVILRVTGDPVQLYLDINSTPAVEAQLRAQLHLDQPLPLQFAHFLGDVARGDFGMSLQYSSPAMPLVLQRLGATLQLMTLALGLALALGVVAGIVCAVYRDRSIDFVISAYRGRWPVDAEFLAGLAVDPGFRPTTRLVAHLRAGGVASSSATGSNAGELLASRVVLLTRTSVLDNLNEPYVVTARSKGLWPRAVLLQARPAQRDEPGADIPRPAGGQIGRGLDVTETIFAWPGSRASDRHQHLPA